MTRGSSGRALLAVLLLLTGGVWIGQGLGLIPGSFMTGHPLWAVIGAILVVAAGALALQLWRGRRRG